MEGVSMENHEEKLEEIRDEEPKSRFQSVLQVDVPRGREGKHKQIITELLNDIHNLARGSALKIPLSELPDSKENIRAALSRAASQRKLDIATSSSEEFLYIWKVEASS
jgi:hypothetical protein